MALLTRIDVNRETMSKETKIESSCRVRDEIKLEKSMEFLTFENELPTNGVKIVTRCFDSWYTIGLNGIPGLWILDRPYNNGVFLAELLGLMYKPGDKEPDFFSDNSKSLIFLSRLAAGSIPVAMPVLLEETSIYTGASIPVAMPVLLEETGIYTGASIPVAMPVLLEETSIYTGASIPVAMPVLLEETGIYTRASIPVARPVLLEETGVR